MTDVEVRELLTRTGALLGGHFCLRSGLHSDKFFQAALVLQYPRLAETLCQELAARCVAYGAQCVISPAVGGIVVGQEIGRSLGVRAIFAEKDQASALLLRRGFTLTPGEKVLIAEDVVTKGGRVQQTIDLVRAAGAEVVGVAILADRSGGSVDFGVPFEALTRLQLATYEPQDCPLCKRGVPLDWPGTK